MQAEACLVAYTCFLSSDVFLGVGVNREQDLFDYTGGRMTAGLA